MAYRHSQFHPAPRNWPASVNSTVLHVISLTQHSLDGCAADSRNARIALKAKLDRANQEIA
jgi:hypothetical protein